VSHAWDTIIREVTVVTPVGPQRLEVGIANGEIAELAPSISGSAGHELVAPQGLLVPGMIDAHVHFNEPGRTHWEGFATGSAAAAAGGVVTVFDMPLNSTPATLNASAYAAKRARADAHSSIKVQLWGGLVPGNLDHLEALHECGVIGFKAFMSNSGIDEFARSDLTTLEAGMRTIAQLPNMRLAVHAEDEELTARLGAAAQAEGRQTPQDFVTSRPIEAELKAIRDVLHLAKETGCPLHIVHVSCAEGIALVTDAKTRGVDVTAETCPHYLMLTADDLDRLGALAKCAPPLRAEPDREALWRCVGDAAVDTIGSDHSPCPTDMKTGRPFAEAWGGISGVQHSLPLIYSEGQRRQIPLAQLADLLSAAPAKRFPVSGQTGRIELGAPADLCLLAPADGAAITHESLQDRYQHSPYVGLTPHWSVQETWVDGHSVFSA